MAGRSDYEILARIEVLLKGQADTKRRLDEIERGGRNVKRSMEGAEDAVSRFGRRLAVAFSAAVIGKVARDSVVAFATLERALNGLVVVMNGLGLETQETFPRIVASLKTIEAAGGPPLRSLVDSFRTFVGITKDAEQALLLVRSASGAAEIKQQDLNAVTQQFANVIQGEATEAAKSLGVLMAKLSGEQKTNAEVLDELIGLYENAGEELDDTAAVLARNQAGWEEFKRVIGSAISSALAWLDSYGVNLSNIVTGVRGKLAGLAEAFRALFEGDFANIGSRAAQAELETIERVAQEKVQTEEEAQKAREKVVALAAAKLAEKRRKEQEKEAEEQAKHLAEMAARKKEIEEQAEDALLAARINATEEGSRERLRLEEQLLERVKDRAVQTAREVGAETLAIEEQFLIARETLRRAYDDREKERVLNALQEALDNRLSALNEMQRLEFEAAENNQALREELEIEALERERDYRLQNWQITEEEKAKLTELYEKIIANTRERYRQSDFQRDRQAALDRINTIELFSTASIDAAKAIFGVNKALAIAQAIISTATAVMRALEIYGPTPIGYAIAAATAAKGALEIQTIRKQDVSRGRGFDDPRNDRMAYLGGRRWADDMIRNISQGFQDGLVRLPASAQTAISTTNNYRDGDRNIYIQGPIYGGDPGLRQLRRELDQAYRRDAAVRVR